MSESNGTDQLYSDFFDHVDASHDGKNTSFQCKKGLWSVEPKHPDDALHEAMKKFIQHMEKGSYDTQVTDQLLTHLKSKTTKQLVADEIA